MDSIKLVNEYEENESLGQSILFNLWKSKIEEVSQWIDDTNTLISNSKKQYNDIWSKFIIDI